MRKLGFRGAGLPVGAVDSEIRALCKRPVARVGFSPHGTSAAAVRQVVASCMVGRDGWIRCRGHVMPVVNGELLYSDATHRRANCIEAFIFTD